MRASSASRSPLPKSTAIFHAVEIEGFHFAGIARGEPMLVSGLGGVQLGLVAKLCKTKVGMQVCKYHGGNPHIDVSELSPQGAEQLGREFGLGTAFEGSPAFDSLVAWARKHPKLAAKVKHTFPLGPWREQAAAAA